MFIIKLDMKLPPNHLLHETIDLLSYYRVGFHTLYVRKTETVIQELLIVDEETREGDLRLAEMAFQMNHDFRQEDGFVCSLCKEKGKESCGHLTFVLREG